MSVKGFFSMFFLVLFISGAFSVSPALAQCGDNPPNSSCITCHEQQGADPISQKGEWHKIHAYKDCCWNCHGGNTQAQTSELAHEGMTAHPLNDIYTDCQSCHQDYSERAERFAALLGVTPVSLATPTRIPVRPIETGAAIALPAATVFQPPFPWQAAIFGASLIGVFIICLALLSRAQSNG